MSWWILCHLTAGGEQTIIYSGPVLRTWALGAFFWYFGIYKMESFGQVGSNALSLLLQRRQSSGGRSHRPKGMGRRGDWAATEAAAATSLSI